MQSQGEGVDPDTHKTIEKCSLPSPKPIKGLY